MDPTSKDYLAQLDNLLSASHQSWLLGAGISRDAGIPLMWPLTDRVFAIAKTNDLKVLTHIREQLTSDSHIEHVLSHIGDYRAIAIRSKDKTINFGKIKLTVDDLDALHHRILTSIAETIRWGYKPMTDDGEISEQIGTHENRIVTIDSHLAFVSALFNRSQAGVVERRRAVKLFTTNYDTLLEDALAL